MHCLLIVAQLINCNGIQDTWHNNYAQHSLHSEVQAEGSCLLASQLVSNQML